MYGYDVFHDGLMMTLINNVRNGTNANTYIFEGAKGLHVFEAAMLLAKALVCGSPDYAPCCSCSSCTEAQAGTHPDILHVVPEKDRATIGVDVIRETVNECMIKPFGGGYKVFIVDDGSLLTPQAQNAFLKVIEEPPDYAVFIIVCTDAELLLETVRSRSVIVTFPAVSDDIVRKYIEEKYPNEPRTDFLVKYCAGIPEAADEIIASEGFEERREEVLKLVPKILSKNKLHAFDVADYFDAHKSDAAAIYDMLLMYLRDALVTVMGAPDKLINTDKSDRINLVAQTYPPELIVRAMDELTLARHMQERYVKASAAAMHAALKTRITA